MYREQARTIGALSLLLDVVCISLAFCLALFVRLTHETLPLLSLVPSIPWNPSEAVPSEYALLFILSCSMWVLKLKHLEFWIVDSSILSFTVLRAHAKASLWALLAVGVAVFTLKMGSISRLFYLYYFLLALSLLLIKHQIFGVFVRHLRQGGLDGHHVLLIGSRQATAWLARVMMRAGRVGYDLVGILVTGKMPPVEASDLPIMGPVGELQRVLAGSQIDEVFIVGGAAEIMQLSPVAQRLIRAGKVVSLVSAPGHLEHGIYGRITDFAGVPMISFGPMPKDEVYVRLKRLIDIVVSALALIVLSPLMLLIAVIIKTGDPGPILFKQERLGLNGKKFRIYKFRSMHIDAEEVLKSSHDLYLRYVSNGYKLPEDQDPRLSRVGRFLRKTSLDEIPQLWNVLKGEMSLVGPRPIVPAEIELYQPYGQMFLAVRPGLTGRWQTDGRSTVPYPQRAFIDLDYVGRHSMVADIAILARTVPAVLKRKGAH